MTTEVLSYITGQLVRAGDYKETTIRVKTDDDWHLEYAGQVRSNETTSDLAGVIVVMPKKKLADAKTLPMYEHVVVIEERKFDAMKAEISRLSGELARLRAWAAKVHEM